MWGPGGALANVVARRGAPLAARVGSAVRCPVTSWTGHMHMDQSTPERSLQIIMARVKYAGAAICL